LEYQYLAGVMGLLAMPIRPLLKGEGVVFGPEEITGITAAFEDALNQLGLVDRKDPVVLLVARTTIDLAKAGERDPQRLSEGVVRLLRAPH
jgi:hypothetical protein